MRTRTTALAAGLLGAMLMSHQAVQAAPRGGYVAALATPLQAPRQAIVGGALWKCAGANCATPAGDSRPLLVCQRLAKTFGQVARFTTPAGDLSNDDLSRCNGQS